MLLEGKVALVSGVGPGLGQACARALAREGARVVLAARTVDNLEATAGEVRGAGGEAHVVPTDLTDRAQVDALAEAVAAVDGRLDVLVHNAFRMSLMQPFRTADLDRWRRVHDVNLWGPLALTQACLPLLEATARSEGDASVVFVSSMSSRKIRPDEADYASSKGAVNTVLRSLAIELGPQRIRVNGIAPGWIGGPNVDVYVTWQAQERGCPPDEVRAEIESRIPLGEIPPQDDIANTIVFMASPWARVVTGQLLDVNGGEYTG